MMIVCNEPHTRFGDDDVSHADFGDVARVGRVKHGVVNFARQQRDAERSFIGDGAVAVFAQCERGTAGESEQAIGIGGHQLSFQHGRGGVLDDDGNPNSLAGGNNSTRVSDADAGIDETIADNFAKAANGNRPWTGLGREAELESRALAGEEGCGVDEAVDGETGTWSNGHGGSAGGREGTRG